MWSRDPTEVREAKRLQVYFRMLQTFPFLHDLFPPLDRRTLSGGGESVFGEGGLLSGKNVLGGGGGGGDGGGDSEGGSEYRRFTDRLFPNSNRNSWYYKAVLKGSSETDLAIVGGACSKDTNTRILTNVVIATFASHVLGPMKSRFSRTKDVLSDAIKDITSSYRTKGVFAAMMSIVEKFGDGLLSLTMLTFSALLDAVKWAINRVLRFVGLSE